MVIPYRDENAKRFLKVTGDLGQIIPLVRFCGGSACRTDRRRNGMRGTTSRSTSASSTRTWYTTSLADHGRQGEPDHPGAGVSLTPLQKLQVH